MKTAALLFATACLSAQTIKLESLDRLAPKAKDAGNVSVNVGGVTVRHFEFDRDGVYADADLADIRSQLTGPAWSKMVSVKSKKDRENTEVYVNSEGDKIKGLVVIVAEPRELTVVNLLGPLDVGKLGDLKNLLGK